MIFDKKNITITNSSSPFAFEWPEEGNGVFIRNDRAVWRRLLKIDNETIFDTGIACDSCVSYFEKLAGNPKHNISIGEQLSATLIAGITKLDEQVLAQAQMLIPNGEYLVILSQATPTLCHPGDENDYFCQELPAYWWGYSSTESPKTEYYRLLTGKILTFGSEGLFIEFIVPILDPQKLNLDRVKYYQKRFEAGEMPTILALSVFDAKYLQQEPEPSGDPYVGHLSFLTHYIIDGHHKAYAAALANKPITLLSFVNKDESVGCELFVDNQETKAIFDFMQNPNKEHERDQLLAKLKDKNAAINARIDALAQLDKYHKYDRVTDALYTIACNSDEPNELVVLIAQKFADKWTHGGTLISDREYTQAKEKLVRNDDFTTLAKDTINEIFSERLSKWRAATVDTFCGLLLNQNANLPTRHAAAEQLAKYPQEKVFQLLYEFCCNPDKTADDWLIQYGAAESLGKIMFELNKLDFALLNELHEQAINGVICAIERAENYVHSAFVFYDNSFSLEVCEYVKSHDNCSTALTKYCYQNYAHYMEICDQIIRTPIPQTKEAKEFYDHLRKKPRNLSQWDHVVVNHVLDNTKSIQIEAACKEIIAHWQEYIPATKQEETYQLPYIEALFTAIANNKNMTAEIQQLTDDLATPKLSSLANDVNAIEFFNMWRSVLDKMSQA